MARGWESKAVEAQMEEAERASGQEKATPTVAADIGKQHRRDALHLTRSRLAQQLQNARSVTHRQMLHQSLRAIDEELATLE